MGLLGILFFIAGILGPVILGFALSLAVVGTGNRLIWLAVAIPAYISVCVAIVICESKASDSGAFSMLGFAVSYGLAAALIPGAILFRKVVEKPSFPYTD